jgi:hypothetical protein
VSATLFAAAALVFLEAGDWKFFGYPILVVAVLVTALYPKYYEPGLVSWAERSLRGVPCEGRVGPRTMTFTEEGIIAEEAKVFWAEVLSLALTPEHLFILGVWGGGFVIPRREIPGATIQAVTEFAEERIRSTERRAAGEAGGEVPR